MPKYIITGGPGAGKTSLVTGLQDLYYPCYAEVSRQLIIEERDTACLPWIDLSCFAGKVLQRMAADFEASVDNAAVFFDRGIPDIVAYLQGAGLPVEEIYYTALEKFRYAPTVFLLPPWQDIYVNDSERWQTFEEAQLLADQIRTVYRQAGYRIVELPRCTVQERILFIQDTLSISTGMEKLLS